MCDEAVQEQIKQKEGAHTWMVIIGVACLVVAVAVGILGRVSGSTVERVGDTTTTKLWPSEALITSLLAVGAVLVVVGFLWARITSIKVAGAEIGMSGDEKKKVVDTLAEKVPEGAKPEEAATAAVGVVTALTEEKAAGASLTDDRISKVVEETYRGPGRLDRGSRVSQRPSARPARPRFRTTTRGARAANAGRLALPLGGIRDTQGRPQRPLCATVSRGRGNLPGAARLVWPHSGRARN